MNYENTLKAARRAGASRANDAQLMALYCADTLQLIAGAVSPALVFEGAQKSGLTTAQLAALKPRAVSELMWL